MGSTGLKSIISHEGKAINEQLEAAKGSQWKARTGCQNQEISRKAKAPVFVVEADLSTSVGSFWTF